LTARIIKPKSAQIGGFGMLGLVAHGKRLFFLTALLICGCSGFSGLILIGSARAPGADGYAEVEEAGRGARVTIHMERLPAPWQLGEGLKYYLVWFEGKGGKTVRGGTLAYKPEERTGDLVRTCPFRKFRIRITAERSQEATAPDELTIAERTVSTTE
jgi:hypothetical protein